jgi:hypothetical protein
MGPSRPGFTGRAMVRRVDEAIEQRDAADEGRLEQRGGTMIGTLIVDVGKIVRPSQLIASVRPLRARGRLTRRVRSGSLSA